jgi:hypothetical protein
MYTDKLIINLVEKVMDFIQNCATKKTQKYLIFRNVIEIKCFLVCKIELNR